MKNLFLALVAFSLLGVLFSTFASATTAGDSVYNSGVRIYADKESYSLGEKVKITASNEGTNFVSYTLCDKVFFSMTDQNGNVISLTNPLLGRPCSTGNLYLRNKLDFVWDQTYFDQSGNLKKVGEGTYVITFAGVSSKFVIGKPSSTSAGLVLKTDKQVYKVGEKVKLIATNNGKEEVYYGACGQYTIFDSDGTELKPFNPLAPCIMIAYSVKPGETKTVGEWEQYYWFEAIAPCTQANPESCVKTWTSQQVQPGYYVADFQGAKAKFVIRGGSTDICSVIRKDTSIDYPVYKCSLNGKTVFKAALSEAQGIVDAGDSYYDENGVYMFGCGGFTTPEYLAECTAKLKGISCSAVDYCQSDDIPDVPGDDTYRTTLTIHKGWNMISVSVYSWDNPACQGRQGCTLPYYKMPKLVESTCESNSLFSYDASARKYVKDSFDSIKADVGYWYRANQDCKIVFEGTRQTTGYEYSQNLQAGWNLISAPKDSVAFESIKVACQLTSGPWYYTGAKYVKSVLLEEGRAYWVKVSNDCTLGSVGTYPDVTPVQISATPVALLTPIPSPTSTVTPPGQCSDSDNGRNYYLRGHTVGVCKDCDEQFRNKDVWDICEKDSYSSNPNSNILFEYRCTNGYFDSESYYCSYGCSEGKCVRPVESSPTPTPMPCTDSDGENIRVKGTTRGYAIGSYDVAEKTDYCSSNAAVVEFFCSPRQTETGIVYEVNNAVKNCPSLCSEGACINVQ